MAITKVGESQAFSYTGDVQTFTAPYAGLYKLETWGAGSERSSGAYAARYVELKKDQTLYVCCGGAGSQTFLEAKSWYEENVPGFSPPSSRTAGGGYNGGASATCYLSKDYVDAWSGGGATHIATETGTLSSLSSNTSAVLIAAGGAGGSGNGQGYYSSSYFGYGVTSGNVGGGGGYYGGSGGGGSYIGTTSNSSTTTYKGETYDNSITAGGGSGAKTSGKATITYVAQGTIFYFNGAEVTELVFDGVEISSLIFDGTKIF